MPESTYEDKEAVIRELASADEGQAVVDLSESFRLHFYEFSQEQQADVLSILAAKRGLSAWFMHGIGVYFDRLAPKIQDEILNLVEKTDVTLMCSFSSSVLYCWERLPPELRARIRVLEKKGFAALKPMPKELYSSDGKRIR